MTRRLREEHHPRKNPTEGILRLDLEVSSAAGQSRFGESRCDIGVSSQQPDVVLLVPVHRIGPAQGGVSRIGIAVELWGKQTRQLVPWSHRRAHETIVSLAGMPQQGVCGTTR